MQQDDLAIIRIEQLYPFPKQELRGQLQLYKNAKTIVWCQEEPKNQGAWFATQHNLHDCLLPGQSLVYAGRPFAAAPAVGSGQLHTKQQQDLILEAVEKENHV